MQEKINNYLSLAKIFNDHGYILYLVGGTVRDYLLRIELTDMDVVTDATPEEMKEFVDGDFTFAKYGSIRIKYNSTKFDVTTLRKETDYIDARHPQKIEFVKDIRLDYPRRDFTVNALYMNEKLEVIDYVNGQEDLKRHLLVMVGNPYQRLKEDPLRIIRCLRFSLMHKFNISKELKKAIIDCAPLVNELNKEKIKMELSKIKSIDKKEIYEFFNEFNLGSVIE